MPKIRGETGLKRRPEESRGEPKRATSDPLARIHYSAQQLLCLAAIQYEFMII